MNSKKVQHTKHPGKLSNVHLASCYCLFMKKILFPSMNSQMTSEMLELSLQLLHSIFFPFIQSRPYYCSQARHGSQSGELCCLWLEEMHQTCMHPSFMFRCGRREQKRERSREIRITVKGKNRHEKGRMKQKERIL